MVEDNGKDLWDEIKKIEKEMDIRAREIGLYERGIFIEPKGNSKEELFKALEHNLVAKIDDKKYLELTDRRKQLLRQGHLTAMIELHDMVSGTPVPGGRYR